MFSENEKISVRQLKRNQWLLLLNMGILLVPLYENEGSVTAGSLAILLLTVFVLWSIWWKLRRRTPGFDYLGESISGSWER